MFVKPAENKEKPGTLLKVRIPHTFALLPDEGQEVPQNQFWMQRLMHGDVVEASPTPAPAPAPAPEPMHQEPEPTEEHAA